VIEPQVLGPMHVTVRGPQRELPWDAPGCLRPALLAKGRPVPVDQLVDDLWVGRPPPSAVNFLHVLISSLRKVLCAESIRTLGRAYLLDVAPRDAMAYQRETVVASEKVPRTRSARRHGSTGP
jgi:DNA-binding SARP family transcriptional activator